MTLGAKDGSIPLLYLALRSPAKLCCVWDPCSVGAPQDSSAGMGHRGGKGFLGEPQPLLCGTRGADGELSELRFQLSARPHSPKTTAGIYR